MSTPRSANSVQLSADTSKFLPLNTVRCQGPGIFRSQLARDFGCLLDVDDDVISWSCQSTILQVRGEAYRPDFTVYRAGITVLVDTLADDVSDCPTKWAADAAQNAGHCYEIITRAAIPAIRLRNSKDLLRYARYEVPLSDRVRLLGALDEQGSLTVMEVLSAFYDIKPIAGIASLVLNRFITIDLDDALIGPETHVRRKRD
ncbi:hypothetical protein [Rhizobium rhizogenes]|uniref:hypothetical protein n=1 Tax=Rhizobium rhizogenes TaxID=359 RepID=UPI0015743F59|nr:hypothetical protein [Rhizobium rhizogenes]NTF64972.1 hypothetical protein [Rhizobium rhizogenes]NTG96320.1 hypothetical protein [Rhizobium rhizogenes]